MSKKLVKANRGGGLDVAAGNVPKSPDTNILANSRMVGMILPHKDNPGPGSFALDEVKTIDSRHSHNTRTKALFPEK